MTNCSNCNQTILDETNFCPKCGLDQTLSDKNSNSNNVTFLTVLCVLTIVGSAFTIGRAYLYEMVSMMDEDTNYWRGWIYAGTAIGTIVGAVMMLQRKLKGLLIYTVFQIVYIITVIIASFSYNEALDDWGGNAYYLASGISMFFIVPSVLFLVLYWTDKVKKLLH